MPVMMDFDRTPDSRVLQVTRAAADAAKRLGLKVDEIIRMARAGAPVSDERANMRFESYGFNVQEGTIYGVWPLSVTPRRPRTVERSLPSPDERLTASRPYEMVEGNCPICDGEGRCAECHSTGTVRRTRQAYSHLEEIAAIK